MEAQSLYISAITVMELEIGVLQIERKDSAQGGILRMWLEAHVLPAFAGRVLSVDADVAIKCARLHVPDPQAERDGLIAATALIHGMTVATRNTDDFKASGAAVINPWDEIKD